MAFICKSPAVAPKAGCCASRSTASRAISNSGRCTPSAWRKPANGLPTRGGCCSMAMIQSQPGARRARPPRLAAARTMTFNPCAEAYITSHRTGWKNAKHAEQWPATIKAYASPVFGSLPVQAIDTGFVMRVLEPIWTTKTETAKRLRGRIERILDWARVKGYRTTAENPARWKGHLDHLLPAPSKVGKVEHHAALPYAEIAGFAVAVCTNKTESLLAP